MNLNLSDKVFFIAGSSRGIGLGIAECFLNEGSKVVLTARNTKDLKKAEDSFNKRFKGQVLCICGDMQDFSTIHSSLEKVVGYFGQLNGLVLNIGSGQEPMGIYENPEVWQTSYDKNVKGSLLMVQAAIPYLKQQGGAITFISSIAGIEDIKAPIAYSMHKAALNAASKKLSRELGSYRIRVNSVAPGNILFPGGSWETKLKNDSKKVEQYMSEEVPLKCLGNPEDIGNICTFLASDKAKFITGSLISVDGGQTRTF